MKQEDIIYKVAKETGFSREIVQQVENTLWNGVRYYITHPLESRRGIRLRYFGIIELKIYNMEKYLEKRMAKEHNKDKVLEPYVTLIKRFKNVEKEDVNEGVS
jgi:hypothetical protein